MNPSFAGILSSLWLINVGGLNELCGVGLFLNMIALCRPDTFPPGISGRACVFQRNSNSYRYASFGNPATVAEAILKSLVVSSLCSVFSIKIHTAAVCQRLRSGKAFLLGASPSNWGDPTEANFTVTIVNLDLWH